MRNRGFVYVLVAGGLMLASGAEAGPTAAEVCSKMIAEGRAGGMSQVDCLCTYRVADAALDADIKALLFDAWLNGTNNMAAVEALPNQRRVVQQLDRMKRSLPKNCP